MKMRIVSLLVALALLVAIPMAFSAYAEDQVILPSYLYDFSSVGILASIAGGINITYSVTEGSHTTIEVLGGDPQLPLKNPGIYVNSAKYLCIEYRTDNAEKAEIYVARDDGVTMSQKTESRLGWDWIHDGEWHRLILYCKGWAETEDTMFTALRFDPVQLGLEDFNYESIDIRFLAFFADENSAKSFDFNAYQEFLRQNGPTTPEGVRPPADFESDPPYVEMETHPDDNTPGTLRITYSEDGKYATVSYGEGDYAVSYTVPNNEINLFGGYAGTDDLDRSLLNASEVGTVTENRKVGVVYYLWHGEHSENGIFNIREITDNVGIDAAGNPGCELWGNEGQWHFWDKPLYGYYFTDDNWVMRKHVELLTNAGVDFLCIDATDGNVYADNALKLMAILHDFNKMGCDAPEIVFRTSANAQDCVLKIYESVYKSNFYQDTWYMQDGKPVIICPQYTDSNGFFTNLASEIRIIYAAQPSTSAPFSDAFLYGDTTSLGRSFTGDANSVQAHNAYYQKLKNEPDSYLHGLYFAEQWDAAVKSDAHLLLVGDWNRWITQRQQAADKVVFDGGVSAEFSSDIEIMTGGYFDNYYMQLARNIQGFKGTAPVIVQDARNAINITGSFEVWDKVQITYTDPAKDMLERKFHSYGNVLCFNETGNNDIVAAKVTADTKNVYFYVQTRENIHKSQQGSSWMQLYISTSGTGWYGYDYIVNYSAKDDDTTTVARYNGTDGAYAYEEIGEVRYRIKGNQMMIEVPLAMLGITNPNGILFQFKWVDSNSKITTMEQFYTDGDAAPLGRLNYIFRNCLDPDTAEPYVPSDALTAKTGCKSESSCVILYVCFTAFSITLFTRKKNRRT